MPSLTTQQATISTLMGQVDALSKAMMAAFVANPHLSMAMEALKSDLAGLRARTAQSASDTAYANGFARVVAEIQAGYDGIDLVVEVAHAKASGNVQ